MQVDYLVTKLCGFKVLLANLSKTRLLSTKTSSFPSTTQQALRLTM